MAEEIARTDAPSAQPKPSVFQLALFGFPALPHSFIALPLNIIIPAFYAANTAVTLAQIAAVTSLSRIFDAATDPAIGYLSDRTRTPLGRRKPWVIAGIFLCAISIYFIFQPPHTAGIVYYATWSFLIYFGFTLFEIPRGAWSSEISRDYHQRSRIQTYVGMFNIAGSFVFFGVPLLLSHWTGTTAITPTALTGIAWLYAVLAPIAIVLAAIYVPNGQELEEKPSTLGQIFKSLGTNKPLWVYFGIVSAWGMGQGAYLSVIIIFLTDYMKLAAVFPFSMIAFFLVAMIALPLWAPLTRRIGKHRTWAMAMGIDVTLRPLMLLLTPGLGSAIPMVLLTCLSAAISAPCNIAPPSVLGDVIDYDILKTRANKAGNFFAINTLLIKATMALGAGAAFMILSFVGYKVGKPNTHAATMGLLFVYFVYPAIWFYIASGLALAFPIDNARHNVIRRRIESRAIAAPAE